MSTALDLESAPFESVKELHRQAEKCLAGTIQLAIAADQRSTTMAGVFGAGSVALLAAIATVLAANTVNRPFIGGAIAMVLCLFAAALTCGMAAVPTDFHVGGYEPKRLARSAGDVIWMLRYALDDMQDRIEFNRAVLERSSWRFRVGMVFAIAAIPLGTLIFIVIRAGPHSS